MYDRSIRTRYCHANRSKLDFPLALNFFLGQLALNLLAIIHEIGLIFQEYVVMDY